MELKPALTDSMCVLLTESGSAITASCIGLGNSTTPPPGQAGKPVPGYNGKNCAKNVTKKGHCSYSWVSAP